MRAGTVGKAASIAGVLAAALCLAVFGASEIRLERTWPQQAAGVPTASGSDAVARGRHVGVALAQCSFCHGADLGGKSLADHPWVGRIAAPNLTAGRGGVARDATDADYVRAIRDGVARDGRSLRLMPSDHFRAMSDADLAAVIAWMRSAPPVDAEHPGQVVGPLTRLAIATGLAPELLAAERIDHDVPPPPAPAPGATAAYGAYLVAVGICRVCHHDDLKGGRHPLALPEEPTPPDLTALAGWTEADFFRAMRAGTTPDGRLLDASYMPWPSYAQLSDTELRAIWAYLGASP